MRIRHKKWAKPELLGCGYFVGNPDSVKGHWRELFEDENPIHIELGCGKGGFISQALLKNRDVNYIAVDIKNEMLGVARRKIQAVLDENNLEPKNIRIFQKNIEQIDSCFLKEDAIDRIYINFCNPWPKPKHRKHRLTHPNQLKRYKTFLRDNAEIHFKTDDDSLFKSSIEYFKECGLEILYITDDLYSSDYDANIPTEHELMFINEGKTIKFLIAGMHLDEDAMSS